MPKRKPSNEPATEGSGLNLPRVADSPSHPSLELDKLELSKVEAGKSDPYSPAPAVESALEDPLPEFSADADQDGCEISPRTIIEAMLFVGGPPPAILTSVQLASLMRGVRPAEVDDVIRELNSTYDEERCPYRIVSVGDGYRMELRTEFNAIRDRFFGRHRGTKLSQQSIDVLAIVAYQQPTTREVIEKLRGKPSGAILNQLVRRQLLRLERPPSSPPTADDPKPKPPSPVYHTTTRFLQLFGLESLAELPYSQETQI